MGKGYKPPYINGKKYKRLVIDGQKLFTGAFGNRVKTCAGAVGEDASFDRAIFIKCPPKKVTI
jgi:hypothetical protein